MKKNEIISVGLNGYSINMEEGLKLDWTQIKELVWKFKIAIDCLELNIKEQERKEK